MHAIILAAGQGTRLRPLTLNKPKCLVRVNGRPILRRQLCALLAAGIEQIHVITGYKGEMVEAYVTEHFARNHHIHVICNTDYQNTNNMYSLWLARDIVDQHDFILMNGDVVVDPSIMADLVAQDDSVICVDRHASATESMKVFCREGSPHISAISKTLSPEQISGCSIDVYRFDQGGSTALFEEIHNIIVHQGQRNEWTEVALDRLVSRGRLRMRTLETQGRPWYEIDDMADLVRAETVLGHVEVAWSDIDLAFVDLDGTLYRGTQVIPGAEAFMTELRRRVPHIRFLSNNSSRSPVQCALHLADLGLAAGEEEIILSSEALRTFLTDKGMDSIFLVGTRALHDFLQTAGIGCCSDTPPAMVHAAYQETGVPAERSIFIGDRLHTDHALARQCGARFIAVLTGDASREDIEDCEDIVVFPSVAQVFPCETPGGTS